MKEKNKLKKLEFWSGNSNLTAGKLQIEVILARSLTIFLILIILMIRRGQIGQGS